MLIICLTAALNEAKPKRKNNDVQIVGKREPVTKLDGTEELGKAINLRGTDLLSDFREDEASVFESIPSKCFSRQDLFYSGSYYDYYASTKDFYSKLAVSAGLDVSLEGSYTLGATLTSVISSEQSSSQKVSGISLNVRALKEKIFVEKDCLDDDSITTLTKHVLRDLEALPLTVESPWQQNRWKPYDVFLHTYGSHVITSALLGANVQQTTFAQSSEAYSQREFQVKSCVSLSGPTEVGDLGVQACANVSNSEISKTTSMNTIDKLFVRGGTEETRNAVLKERTKELIEKLLNEAGESPAAVEHTFREIWDIFQSRFTIGSENYIRAINLQYYYLGYLNYGCDHEESGGVQLQKFDYTSSSTKQSPEFECTLASEGCHSNDDCHYKPIWCNCRGPSCVGYKSIELDTGVHKQHAFANDNGDWAWHGCAWKVAGSKCACYNSNRNTRKQVWRMPNRDAPQKGASHGAHQDDDNSGQDQDTEVNEFSGGEKEE